MIIRKIISGGQTGADQGGLEGARLANVPTGGTAPAEFKTETGPNPRLGPEFGLTTLKSSSYSARTYKNVKDSDATLWIGMVSPGFRCTNDAAYKLGIPLIKTTYNQRMKKFSELDVDFASDFFLIELENMCKVFKRLNLIVNVAGNRESINPGIQHFTKEVIFKLLKKIQAKYPIAATYTQPKI